MKNNSKILIAICVSLIAVSYFVTQNKQSFAQSKEQLLVPELLSQVNDVDAIVINHNDKITSLYKHSGIWKISEVDDFLVDANRVANLLLELRKIKLKQKKTNNPKNYKSLSLAESGDNAAIKITLNISGNEIADISIGKKASKSQGVYVRKNSESQTWLAEGSLDIKLSHNDWIVTTLLDIDSRTIKSVEYQPVDSKFFKINKLTPNDTNFVLQAIADDMQLKADVDIESLARGLQKFTIDSVFQNDNDDKINDKIKVISVVYQLFSGMQYTLDVFKYEEQYLLNIILKNETSRTVFEKQLENWTYVIPSYKFEALNKQLSNLIEAKQEQSKSEVK